LSLQNRVKRERDQIESFLMEKQKHPSSLFLGRLITVCFPSTSHWLNDNYLSFIRFESNKERLKAKWKERNKRLRKFEWLINKRRRKSKELTSERNKNGSENIKRVSLVDVQIPFIWISSISTQLHANNPSCQLHIF
jgi:hypothetical protein